MKSRSYVSKNDIQTRRVYEFCDSTQHKFSFTRFARLLKSDYRNKQKILSLIKRMSNVNRKRSIFK